METVRTRPRFSFLYFIFKVLLWFEKGPTAQTYTLHARMWLHARTHACMHVGPALAEASLHACMHVGPALARASLMVGIRDLNF